MLKIEMTIDQLQDIIEVMDVADLDAIDYFIKETEEGLNDCKRWLEDAKVSQNWNTAIELNEDIKKMELRLESFKLIKAFKKERKGE